MFDLDKKGWCTPTILTAFIGLLGVIVLASQAITDKEREERRAKIIAMLSKLAWTVIMVALLYWLCSKGKTEASWWIFGLLYLLPIVAMFIILAGVAFKG